MMKKVIASLLMLTLVVALGLTVSADYPVASVISMANKLPIETPNFVPEIDGVKDAGYTVDTLVAAPGGSNQVHENTYISTAWNGNTLYFYIYVPDTTRQDSVVDKWMYDMDGVWFLLDFGGEREVETMWKTQKTSKVFKILPGVEDVCYVGCVHEESIKPVNPEDLQYKIVWDDNGYAMEVAYTVPTETTALAAAQEITFDLEVFDVYPGNPWYRYHINNTDINAMENYCSAWGAKLVLKEAPAVEEPPVDEGGENEGAPETADAALSLAIVAVVAAVATGVVLKKKHF